MAVNVATIKATFTLDNEPLKKGLRDSEQAIRKSSKSIEERMKETGQKLSLAITAPLVALGAGSVKLFADFESTIGLLGETAGASAADLEKMSALAKQLGADVKIPGASAKDAAETMLELNKAGLDVNQTMAAAKPAMQLAAAGGLENARAAEIAASAMNTFGQSAAALPRINDLLANAASASSAEITDLAESVTYGGAAARTAGYDFEQFSTVLALLAQRNIKGSAAGTTLTSALGKLANPTKEATQLLNKMGLGQGRLFNSMKDSSKAAELLKKAFSGLSREEKLRNAQILVGEQGARLLITLMDTSAESIKKTEQAMKRQGSAADLAAARNKGLKGSLDALKSSIESAGISIGEVLAPYVKRVADFIADLVGKFDKLSPSTKSWVVGILAAAAALGPTLVLLGNLITACKSIATVMIAAKNATGLLGAAIKLLSGPVGWAIAAASLIYVAWQNNWGSIRDITMSAIDFITASVAEFAQGLGQTFGGLEMAMSGHWKEGWDEIKAGASRAWNSIAKGAEIAGANDAKRTQERVNREKNANAKIVADAKKTQSQLDAQTDTPTTKSYGTAEESEASKRAKQEAKSFAEMRASLSRQLTAATQQESDAVVQLLGQYGTIDVARLNDVAGMQQQIAMLGNVSTQYRASGRALLEHRAKSLEELTALRLFGNELTSTIDKTKALTGYVDENGKVVKATATVWGSLTKEQQKSAQTAASNIISDASSEMHDNWRTMKADAEAQRDVTGRLGFAMKFYGDYLRIAVGNGKSLVEATNELSDSAKSWLNALVDVDTQMKLNQEYAQGIRQLRDYRTQLTAATTDNKLALAVIENFPTAWREAAIAGGTVAEILERIDAKTLKVAGSIVTVQDNLGKTAAWKQAGNAVQGIFYDMFGAVNEGFDGMFQSIVKGFDQLLTDMAKEYLASLLLQLVANAFGMTLPAGMGPGSTRIGQMFGGGKAEGGHMDYGQTYLVGEKGPEFVQGPLGGATVTPMSASAPNVYVTINANDVQSFQRSRQQVRQDIGTAVRDAVGRR